MYFNLPPYLMRSFSQSMVSENSKCEQPKMAAEVLPRRGATGQLRWRVSQQLAIEVGTMGPNHGLHHQRIGSTWFWII